MAQYKLDYGDDVCPICDNKTLIHGEMVDFSQITPHTCDFCGWVQPKDKEEFEKMKQLAKCWELQIDFWNRN